MKIAYIDLNYEDLRESYSINPSRYGGGRVFASWAKEKFSEFGCKDFCIFSDKESFSDITDQENSKGCFVITDQAKDRLRKGEPVANVLPNLENYDLILHHFTSFKLKTKTKQVVWAVGYGDTVLDQDYLILYNDLQSPKIYGKSPKIYYAKIGVPNRQAKHKKLGNYIFQCSRHNKEFGTLDVAQLCLKHKSHTRIII